MSSERAEVRYAKFKELAVRVFGQDLTHLHVDKLVLKLLQYAGNYFNRQKSHMGLAQIMSPWEGIKDQNPAPQLALFG